jgi:hypothetical protein
MVSDLEKVIEHVIQSVFHHGIVRVHVIINYQGQLIGAWILGILALTTSFKCQVCRDGEVSFISRSQALSFLVLF